MLPLSAGTGVAPRIAVSLRNTTIATAMQGLAVTRVNKRKAGDARAGRNGRHNALRVSSARWVVVVVVVVAVGS